MSMPPGSPLPQAEIRAHRGPRFSFIWLVPIVAALIAGWLVWRTLSSEGPQIVVTFRTADGITAGQTKVKHKAVDLGTVQGITLSKDLNSVEVRIDMGSQASRMLSDSARFWVVRPRLTSGNISGLETVVSGSYIEMDPGNENGARQTRYTGLEDPPAIRSGEPGTTIALKADRIGSLGSGSPLFYRDIAAGEVLNYDLGPDGNGVTIHAFVRAPYDKFIHPASHFWNASGIAVDLGAQGVQIRVASLQAVLSGGIAFDTPDSAPHDKPSAKDAVFTLFHDEPAARSAGYSRQVKLVAYFDNSVRGLTPGAQVQINGIQIGLVTDVRLQVDFEHASSRVAVHMEIQPQRFMAPDQIRPEEEGLPIAQGLVRHGLRAQLSTANFLTGQMLVDFEFQPDSPKADARMEGDEIVVPGMSGGLDSITANLSSIAQKLEALPLDQVVRNLNDTLHGVSAVVNGSELRDTLASVETAARRLPEVAQRLDATLGRADHLVGSAESGYGEGSQVNRDISRLLAQLSDTARSVRVLADYLSLHPQSLLLGRADRATGR